MSTACSYTCRVAVLRWPLTAFTVAIVGIVVCAFTHPAAAQAAAPAELPSAPAHSVGLVADDGARVVNQTVVAPRMVDLAITSPALGSVQTVRLLLPPDWDTRPASRWPVLYLLHGCCDDYQSWTRSTDVAQLSADTDVLVVMPEAGRAGYYSNWLNGPAWETFHLVEVRQLLERGFRASTRRAIAGLSMGGFGAMSYSTRNPGMFKAAAAYSGRLDTTYNQESIRQVQDIVSSQDHVDPDALWGDPVRNADVWAAHNPYDHAGRLRGTQLYIYAGTGQPGPLDAPGTAADPAERLANEESTRMVARLGRLGIPVTAELTDAGTHSWPYWQRALHASFPMLMRAIGAQTAMATSPPP
ncbi:MAG: esterase family protein [Kutzneria sp.]|nr:esterase family protein [Kutzneria sp.]